MGQNPIMFAGYAPVNPGYPMLFSFAQASARPKSRHVHAVNPEGVRNIMQAAADHEPRPIHAGLGGTVYWFRRNG